MKTPTHSTLHLVLATLALLTLALPASLMAQTTYGFTNSVSGTVLWSSVTSSNLWVPSGTPGTNDNVSIRMNYASGAKTFRADGNLQVANLDLTSGGTSSAPMRFTGINGSSSTLTVTNTINIVSGYIDFTSATTNTVFTVNTANLNIASPGRLRLGLANGLTTLNVTGRTTNTGGQIIIQRGDQDINLGHLDNTGAVDLGNSTAYGTNYTVKVSSLSGNIAGSISNSAAVHTTLEIGATNNADASSANLIQDGAGVISLVKKGSGTQTLGNNNTYTGGTTIAGGTLKIGNGGGSGTIAGDIVNNATLELSRKNLTWSNTITGTGNVRITGDAGGTNIFTNNNSYSGGTEIVSNTLQLGNGGTTGAAGTGAITNNATLQVNRSDTYTLSNTISGTGNLIKDGTGETILTALNTYTGNTTVTDGKLTLDNGAGLTFLIGANGVNNSIGGTSTLQLDGAFTFDLSGADTTYGNTWGIVDMLSLAASYGGTFAVNSTLGAFTNNANVWSLGSGGNTWSFTEATGVLTVVPEPHVNLLLALSVLALGILAWKRKTVASASSR